MSKKPNHQADIRNPNRGTSGTNATWDKAQGNRGKQLGPSWTPPRGRGRPTPPAASPPPTTPPAIAPKPKT
ncbi:MAG: hypothetical protein IPJ61_21150 [Tessaracoccus sp.]|uniref:hypothetical protein n=1 Tax=Tessaracoccus sp. TaxID=1971211 RepID=UPI001EB9E0B3|nr:hypothetical protein [Tessaracoccus sp.]MBK7823496.1 hypothetical protein [Tessaracoccus sp.]